MPRNTDMSECQAHVVVDPPRKFGVNQRVRRPMVVELTPVPRSRSWSQDDFLADATLCGADGRPVADRRGRTLEDARLGTQTGGHDGVESVFFVFADQTVEIVGRFMIRFEVRFRGGVVSDYAYTRVFEVLDDGDSGSDGEQNGIPPPGSAHWAGLTALEYDTIETVRRRVPDSGLRKPPIRRPHH